MWLFPRRRFRLDLEDRLALWALLAALPATVTAVVCLWWLGAPLWFRLLLTVALPTFSLFCALVLRRRLARPLRTLANLLEALRVGDYSLRGHADGGDAFGEVVREINALAEDLHHRRLGAVEAANLLETVMEEIEVAVFAFDEAEALALVNRAGARLLAARRGDLLGRPAADLGFEDLLRGSAVRTVEHAFAGGSGRFGLRRGTFRLGGRRHQLLVMADLSRALRQEERQAWQRLIRVLGHELNNSLTPIRSLSSTMRGLIHRDPRPEDWEQDLDRGLSLVEQRSLSLTRFIGAYSRLARLPEPSMGEVELRERVARVTELETRVEIAVFAGPELLVQADADQLDQLLINLLTNAADAALETGGGVRLRWRRAGGFAELDIEDEGEGLASTENLFVPFYTTKPGGTGIGLVLSRQIAEAHGGTLSLSNRPEGGCLARLRLPLG
ncbi:MAG: ATP-binding protein [Acidobacteriota bacterium]